MGLSLECTHNSRIQIPDFDRLPHKCHDLSYLDSYVVIYFFFEPLQSLYEDRRRTGWSHWRYFRWNFRFAGFWGVMVFWTASFWLTSKLYIQYKLYVGNFVKNTLWGGMCLSTDSNTRDWDVTKVTFWCHKMWLMSRGFKRATENWMTSESVTKWLKMVPDWSECVAKRVAKWTGSTTGN